MSLTYKIFKKLFVRSAFCSSWLDLEAISSRRLIFISVLAFISGMRARMSMNGKSSGTWNLRMQKIAIRNVSTVGLRSNFNYDSLFPLLFISAQEMLQISFQ